MMLLQYALLLFPNRVDLSDTDQLARFLDFATIGRGDTQGVLILTASGMVHPTPRTMSMPMPWNKCWC
jgi:hypothetical protein